MERVKHNRIQCKFCGDIIESKHRHDFVECSCGSCFTDGGHDYMRCAGDFIDLSEWEEVPDDYQEEEEESELTEAQKLKLLELLGQLKLDFSGNKYKV